MWHIATIVRRNPARIVTAFLLTFCVAGRARAQVDTTHGAVRTDTVTPLHVTHVRTTRHYTLVAVSQRDLDVAASELTSTAARFISLFGEEPRPIDVNVLAASVSDSIHSSMREDVGLLAISAWTQALAHDWCRRVAADPRAFVDPPETPLTCDGDVPDWLALGSIQVLADPKAEEEAAIRLADPRAPLLPLAELFERKLVATDTSSSDTDGALFIAQSISVMRYLRLVEGSGVLADIARASTAGLAMREILERLPQATTPERLEKGWRQWLAASNANF